jgi:nucleoside-diphosphate-sugar epimerase
MHRYFDIQNARRDLKYSPVVEFREGWGQTVQWFREHWLPSFNKQ